MHAVHIEAHLPHPHRWGAAATVAIFVLALNAAIAGIAISQAGVRSVVPTSTWTGFVAHDDARGFAEVAGSWIVPDHPDCKGSTVVGIWAGLGGWKVTPAADRSVIDQAGIAMSCDRLHETITGFTETYPDPPKAVDGLDLAPGDVINVDVVRSGVHVHFVIDDVTSGTRATFDQVEPRMRFTSAECILEATPPKPGEDLHVVAVSFTSCGGRQPGGAITPIDATTTSCTAAAAKGSNGYGRVSSMRCAGRFDVAVTHRQIPDVLRLKDLGYPGAVTTR